MKLLASSLLAALSLIGSAQGASIENDHLRLSVAPDGSIVELYDKVHRLQLVTAPALSRLFELMIPDESNYSRRIDSRSQHATIRATGAQIDVQYSGLRPAEEQIRFGSGPMHFAQPQLAIDVAIRLRLDDDHVEATLSLENGSEVTVSGVIFPFVGGLAADLNGGAGQIVVPSTSQRRYTHTLGLMSGERALRYPAVLASSWLDFEYPGTVSVALEARTGLEVQDALFALSPGPFGPGSAYWSPSEFPFLAWVQYPHVAPHQAWTSSALRLHVHQADWHQVAGEHREWFREARRPSVSARWREENGFATYSLKDEQNLILKDYASLDELSRTAATAGFRHVIVEGWRAREGGGNPAPFGEIADPRLGGAAGLHAAIQRAKAAGVSLVLAYHPTLLNQVDGRFRPELANWSVHTQRNGRQMRVDALMETHDDPRAIDGSPLQLEIDPSSSAQAFLVGDIERLHRESGVDSLLLRGVGQQAFLSYFNQHGLPPQVAYERGYSSLLKAVRSLLPGGLLLAEGMNDLIDPFVDGAYLWNPSREAEVLAYSLPWQRFSRDIEALDYTAANEAFVGGLLLNLIVDGGAGSVARYPAFAAHLLGLKRLRQSVPGLVDLEFRDRDGALHVQEAALLAWAGYADTSGRRQVTLIANLCDCDSGAEVQLRGESRAVTQTRMDGTRLPLPLKRIGRILLKPHEVVALEIS